MPERAVESRETPDRAPSPPAGAAREQPLLALQRSAGNRATMRYLARTELLARETSPDVELLPLPAEGDSMPPSAWADPRDLSDWIDRRVTQVGYSLGLAGFVIWVGGPERPMFVPESHFAFDDTPMVAADKRVHPTWEAAADALPAGPPAPGQPGLFGFHRAPGATIVPTVFTPQTAPRVVATALEAKRRLADEVSEEFVQMFIGMVAPRVLMAAVNGFCKAVAWAAGKAVKKFPGPSGPKPEPPTGAKPGKHKSAPSKAQPRGAVKSSPLGLAGRFRSADEFGRAVKEALSKLKTGMKSKGGGIDEDHLPPLYHDALKALQATKSPVNDQLFELTPVAAAVLRDPDLAAEVMAAAWSRAARNGTDINAALISLATEGGISVKVTAKLENGDVFFQEHATFPARIVDPGAGAKHGELTHLLQDLILDLGFTRAGKKIMAVEFRGLLKQAAGTELHSGLPAGDVVWRATYDVEPYGHMNTPESLKGALEPFGLR